MKIILLVLTTAILAGCGSGLTTDTCLRTCGSAGVDAYTDSVLYTRCSCNRPKETGK